MLSIDLTGKTALITGGAQGIGAGCARALNLAGAKIILNDLSSQEERLREMESAMNSCQIVMADVFDEFGRECLMRQIEGGIDIFVSNPYRSIRCPVLDFSLEDFQSVIAATLSSHFHMAQLVVSRMKAHRAQGSVVFISSIYGSENRAGSVAYDTAKAGMNHMMRVFARELAPHRIRVNAIAPGYTDTPGERRYASDEEIRKTAVDLPFGELCLPEDIGNAVAFLSSNLARMVTGHVFVVDGGMSLCDFSYRR